MNSKVKLSQVSFLRFVNSSTINTLKSLWKHVNLIFRIRNSIRSLQTTSKGYLCLTIEEYTSAVTILRVPLRAVHGNLYLFSTGKVCRSLNDSVSFTSISVFMRHSETKCKQTRCRQSYWLKKIFSIYNVWKSFQETFKIT